MCNLINPLLILLTLAHCKPWIKWRISSTTLPNNEWLANDEEMAIITLTLSPSIISLAKPASTAKWLSTCKQFYFLACTHIRATVSHCRHNLHLIITNYCSYTRFLQPQKDCRIEIKLVDRWWTKKFFSFIKTFLRITFVIWERGKFWMFDLKVQ